MIARLARKKVRRPDRNVPIGPDGLPRPRFEDRNVFARATAANVIKVTDFAALQQMNGFTRIK